MLGSTTTHLPTSLPSTALNFPALSPLAFHPTLFHLRLQLVLLNEELEATHQSLSSRLFGTFPKCPRSPRLGVLWAEGFTQMKMEGPPQAMSVAFVAGELFFFLFLNYTSYKFL